MNYATLLILAWLTPLLLAAAAVTASRLTWKAMAVAGLPGLAAALMVPTGSSIELSSLLLGSRFGLDRLGQGFLIFTSAIWILAAWHATGYITTRRRAFACFFLLAMSGNLGLVLARDMICFYLFFALMSFASYGLVVHERTPAARYAGKVYIILVVVGEVLLFSGMAGVATLAGTTLFTDVGTAWLADPLGTLFFGLLLLGFAIKAGALPLHVWLPLAHPAAPTPASAVLSGAMIKAGLLGWLRFLPVGETALPGWGAICAGLGALACILAAAYGCLQSHPKALLAYSSISKMGLMTVALGVVLAEPASAPVVLPGVLAFATFHCLCKGALFLSVSIDLGAVRAGPLRWLTTLLLLVSPLSLAGFALTGGAAAKSALKTGLSASLPPAATTMLAGLLLLNSLLTAAMMFRFCHQRLTPAAKTQHAPARSSFLAWATLVALVAATPLLLDTLYPSLIPGKWLSPAALWNSAWPVLAGGGLMTLFMHFSRSSLPELPPGDILHLGNRLSTPAASLAKSIGKLAAVAAAQLSPRRFLRPTIHRPLAIVLHASEEQLKRPVVFGLFFMVLLALSLFLLL